MRLRAITLFLGSHWILSQPQGVESEEFQLDLNEEGGTHFLKSENKASPSWVNPEMRQGNQNNNKNKKVESGFQKEGYLVNVCHGVVETESFCN